MTILTVTAKGQITLRQSVLRHLGVGPGDKLDVELMPDGQAILRGASEGRIEDVFGFLPHTAQRQVSVEDMNAAIEAGWAGDR
ncbi:MAG: AbrB/MazE/SpoVT family DNA-binding domain-containing protein [Bifidobacteriaceae bacterium]|nr:AbrB/MazE/SpoVT family DNA-binding domain-containing protein [Bifidobacteriaceae bacterium]